MKTRPVKGQMNLRVGVSSYLLKLSSKAGGHWLWSDLKRVNLPKTHYYEYLSCIQPRYVEGIGQVFSCTVATLWPHLVMGTMMIMTRSYCKNVLNYIFWYIKHIFISRKIWCHNLFAFSITKDTNNMYFQPIVKTV